ncbi:UNVERIFIED_CONTAM: hypothetical protein Sindi_0762400 [Sesamum indicum]
MSGPNPGNKLEALNIFSIFENFWACLIYLSADELLDPNLDLQKAEEGFRGTLLASTISSQAISEACSN